MVYSKEQNKSLEPSLKKQRLWTLNIFKASVLNVLKLKENPKNKENQKNDILTK